MPDEDKPTVDTGEAGQASTELSPGNWEDRYKSLESKFLERDEEISQTRRQVINLSDQLQNLAHQNQNLLSQLQPQNPESDIEDLAVTNPKAYKDLLKKEILGEVAPVMQQLAGAVTGIQKQSDFFKRNTDLDDPDMRIFIEQEAYRVYNDPTLSHLPENQKMDKVAQGARMRAKQLHETLSKKFQNPKPPHMGGGGAGNVSPSQADDEPMSMDDIMSAYIG